MKGKINGKAFEAELFGFDGCHKIYLCDTLLGQRSLEELGYELYPIEELPEIWVNTCPLRFILSGDLRVSYVNQFEPAEFVGWELEGWLIDKLELMKREQLEANEEEW